MEEIKLTFSSNFSDLPDFIDIIINKKNVLLYVNKLFKHSYDKLYILQIWKNDINVIKTFDSQIEYENMVKG